MKRRLSPQLSSRHIFIEKRNTCHDRTKIVHNVQFGVGYPNKETENKKKIPIPTLIELNGKRTHVAEPKYMGGKMVYCMKHTNHLSN